MNPRCGPSPWLVQAGRLLLLFPGGLPRPSLKPRLLPHTTTRSSTPSRTHSQSLVPACASSAHGRPRMDAGGPARPLAGEHGRQTVGRARKKGRWAKGRADDVLPPVALPCFLLAVPPLPRRWAPLVPAASGSSLDVCVGHLEPYRGAPLVPQRFPLLKQTSLPAPAWFCTLRCPPLRTTPRASSTTPSSRTVSSFLVLSAKGVRLSCLLQFRARSTASSRVSTRRCADPRVLFSLRALTSVAVPPLPALQVQGRQRL